MDDQSQLEARAAAVENLQKVVGRQLSEYSVKLNRRRNSLLPIYRLPVELLIDIFLRVIDLIDWDMEQVWPSLTVLRCDPRLKNQRSVESKHCQRMQGLVRHYHTVPPILAPHQRLPRHRYHQAYNASERRRSLFDTV